MAKKILVVEDEEDLVSIVHVRLAGSGYEVISANDGVEGLKKAETENPDLIMMDVMMPRMHGFDALSKLKENPATKSIPVIMLTAIDDEKSVARAKKLGAVDFISKPFNFEAMINTVKRHLRDC